MNKCEECEALKGHAPECSRMTPEQVREELTRYVKAWREAHAQLKYIQMEEASRHARHNARLREQAAYWQGKFNAVKHENNKLRMKLRKLEN